MNITLTTSKDFEKQARHIERKTQTYNSKMCKLRRASQRRARAETAGEGPMQSLRRICKQKRLGATQANKQML
eukprot:7932374-Heterocapsa_arctica.AAC.1